MHRGVWGGARPTAHASFSRAKANHITTSSATTHATADFPVVLVAAVLVLCWCSLLFNIVLGLDQGAPLEMFEGPVYDENEYGTGLWKGP